MQLAQTFLFVGAILVAFQYVGDIGYIATLFSMPFALPIQPLMKKLGLSYKRVSPVQLSFQIDQPTERKIRSKMIRVIWWVLFILSIIIFSIVTLATQPIMIAYLLICRPLLGINKLLNLIYEKTISQWDIIYLVNMQNRINFMQNVLKIKTTKKRYSDKDLLRIRKEKGEIPFVAFIGLIFLVAGFILQLTQ